MEQKEGFNVNIRKLIHRFRNRVYKLNNRKITMNRLGYQDNSIQVWYENEVLHTLVENMPDIERIIQVFKGYKLMNGMDFNYLLITNDWDNDNWFYPDDKVWVITLRGVADTICETLELGSRDVSHIKEYFAEQGLKW